MRQSLSSQSSERSARGLRPATWAGVCLAVLLLGGLGCGVDDRVLLSADSSAGGHGAGGSSGSSGDLAGDGGDTSQLPVLPRCFYLGTSVESGCETLVKNAGFGSNVASWVAEPVGMTEGWLNADAQDNAKSGSLSVMNLNYKTDATAQHGSNGGAARQCVPITAGQIYDLAADVFIASGQGAGFEDQQYVSVASLSIFYYEGSDCSGRTASNFTSTPVDRTDEWVHVEGSTTAPKDAVSMAVRLATLKPFRQIQFEAHFDNVFVRERSTP